jgi:hypothetical protein
MAGLPGPLARTDGVKEVVCVTEATGFRDDGAHVSGREIVAIAKLTVELTAEA